MNSRVMLCRWTGTQYSSDRDVSRFRSLETNLLGGIRALFLEHGSLGERPSDTCSMRSPCEAYRRAVYPFIHTLLAIRGIVDSHPRSRGVTAQASKARENEQSRLTPSACYNSRCGSPEIGIWLGSKTYWHADAAGGHRLR